MKKKLKIFLILFSVIILGGSGYLLYLFKFKQYDVADDEVSEIISVPYEIELPDGSIFTVDPEGDVVEATKGDKNSTSSESKEKIQGVAGTTTSTPSSSTNATPSTDSTSTPNKTPSTTTPSTPPPAEKPTVAVIKDKYRPVFQGLEAQADQKLNTLIGRAKGEYQQKKANGETIDFGYFFSKYNGAAKSLEANTDAAFYGILSALKKELTVYDYSNEHAKSFEEEYATTKKALREGLISKAMGR
ncbi:hypothetical protein ACXYMX_15570 [Sporosarcina sp. CAU 1771]